MTTAEELYREARRRYPDAPAVSVDLAAQTDVGGDILYSYQVAIWDAPISTNAKRVGGFGFTADAAFAELEKKMKPSAEDLATLEE